MSRVFSCSVLHLLPLFEFVGGFIGPRTFVVHVTQFSLVSCIVFTPLSCPYIISLRTEVNAYHLLACRVGGKSGNVEGALS